MDFSKLRTTEGLDVSGKRVMVRVDLNVPLRDGVVTDPTRIVRTAPCLLDLASRGAKVIVVSHLGRPKGKPQQEYSLAPVASRMSEVLRKPVRFASDCIGPAARDAVEALAPGDILLLENLRFHSGEEANDPTFAAELAKNADIFVGEAF